MNKWILGVLMLVLGIVPLKAQEEEGPSGGINTPSGLSDLKASQQQGPFSEFPWNVQSLLEENLHVLQKMPVSVRGYVLKRAMDWDVLFDAEKHRITQFFKKAKEMPGAELEAVFKENGDQTLGIERTIDHVIRGNERPPLGLVVVVIGKTNVTRTGSAIHQDVVSQGNLYRDIAFEGDWLSTFLAGSSPGQSHFLEHIRKQRKLKQRDKVIAVVDTVPAVLMPNRKGDGKKDGPMMVASSELEKSRNMALEILQKESGKSKGYLDMVKAKWTPASLKMPKVYQDKALGALLIQTMITHDGLSHLDDDFNQVMALRLMWRAQPDALLIMLSDADEVARQTFTNTLVTGLKNHARYEDNTLLVIVDEGRKQVFLYGVEALSMDQKVETLSDVSNIIFKALEQASVGVSRNRQ